MYISANILDLQSSINNYTRKKYIKTKKILFIRLSWDTLSSDVDLYRQPVTHETHETSNIVIRPLNFTFIKLRSSDTQSVCPSVKN